MLEEFEKSVKATLYDRLTSPLIGTFIVAWSIVNYKFFLIIFSGLNYYEKINALETVFQSSNYISSFCFFCGWDMPIGVLVLLNTIIIPLFWTVVYIWIYPTISILVFARWQEYNQEKSLIKYSHRSKLGISKKDLKELKKAVFMHCQKNAIYRSQRKEIEHWKSKYNALKNKK